MSKVAVVFWSGTGNTGVMATNVAEGAKEAGAQADVIFVSDFSADKMDEYDAIAFGCPSMGAEQLETGMRHAEMPVQLWRAIMLYAMKHRMMKQLMRARLWAKR